MTDETIKTELDAKTEQMRKDRETADYGCSAVVTMKIEVRSKGSWGGDATVQEVQRIGGRETIYAINEALRIGGLDYKVIGEPDVGAVTWKRTRK